MLPEDVKSKLAIVLAAAEPLGELRVQELLRETTLSVANQVISEIELKVAAELAARRAEKPFSRTRFVSAGFVLPELRVE